MKLRRKMNEDAIVESCLFRPHYSGDDSEKFWREVRHQANDRTLYEFACALQDIEARLLSAMNPGIARRASALIRTSRTKKPRPATR